MISLGIVGSNLVLTTDKSTLVGTEIFVSDTLKFTVTADGLISNILGAGVDEESTTAYVVIKYNNNLIMVNIKALNANYGQYFEAGVNEDKVLWFKESQSTGTITPWTYEQSGQDVQYTGYYIASDGVNPLPLNTGAYVRLILKEDGYFYIHVYLKVA